MGHVPCEHFGTLDEWLSQWSAKPCTAVRIRQVPQKHRSSGAFFDLMIMADNFLEKRMEQHRAQAASSVAQKSRATLAALIDKCVAAPSADGYAVRADQLKRIVSAAVRVPACSALRYKLLLPSCAPLFESASFSSATAYIVICSSCEPDAFVLGRAVQVMQLQAAEIGLSAMLVEDVDAYGVTINTNPSKLF